MFFSKTYCLGFLYTDGLVNLKFLLEKHLMQSPPLPTHLVMQVWNEALLSVFVRQVSGAGRLFDLQLHGWTPVSEQQMDGKNSAVAYMVRARRLTL